MLIYYYLGTLPMRYLLLYELNQVANFRYFSSPCVTIAKYKNKATIT